MTAQPATASRLPFIDAIKAIASQLIVLHHLAFYGPMSDYVQTICPETIAWLSQHARIAVQAFLVMGGFLAAQALARDGKLTDKPVLQLIRKRYVKLVTPYLVALALAVAGAAIARSLITHDSIPGVPTIAQLVAHTMLLQSVLGFDGLSAGVWYVAIDFQLYVFLLIVIWLSRRLLPEKPSVSLWCVLAFIAVRMPPENRAQLAVDHQPVQPAALAGESRDITGQHLRCRDAREIFVHQLGQRLDAFGPQSLHRTDRRTKARDQRKLVPHPAGMKGNHADAVAACPPGERPAYKPCLRRLDSRDAALKFIHRAFSKMSLPKPPPPPPGEPPPPPPTDPRGAALSTPQVTVRTRPVA